MHDSVLTQTLPAVSCEQVRTHVNTALALPSITALETTEPLTEQRAGRGRPRHLQQGHLWLGLLWAVLEGVQGYSALTRYLEPIRWGALPRSA